MCADKRRVRRAYGRVRGVVVCTGMQSFDVIRDVDGAIIHIVISNDLVVGADGLSDGDTVTATGLILADGQYRMMRADHVERVAPRSQSVVTAADLPHVDITGGLGSIAYVRRVRDDR